MTIMNDETSELPGISCHSTIHFGKGPSDTQCEFSQHPRVEKPWAEVEGVDGWHVHSGEDGADGELFQRYLPRFSTWN